MYKIILAIIIFVILLVVVLYRKQIFRLAVGLLGEILGLLLMLIVGGNNLL